MTDFDLSPGAIHRGLGFIARWPGIVLVIPSDPAHDQRAEELLISLGTEPTPAEMARMVRDAIDDGSLRVAGYLAMATGGPLAMVYGPIEVLTDGEPVLSGIGGPNEQQVMATERLTLRAANLSKAAEPTTPFDLRRGIAPGAGITLGNPEMATNVRPSAPPRPDHVLPEPPVGEAPVQPEVVAVPFQSVLLFDQDIQIEQRPPLPVAGPATVGKGDTGRQLTPPTQDQALPDPDHPHSESVQAPGPEEAMVHGIVCSRGHFNNPAASYCMVCGISMVHVTHNLVPGPRPTLGFVVFDDGSTFGLDRSYLVGREPGETHDPLIAPLTIQDNNETLSRRHAEIRLIEWGVHLVDLKSTNGSFIWDVTVEHWNQIAPNQPVPLAPGDTVALGRRTFVYESVTRL